jgi:hypothetical protein
MITRLAHRVASFVPVAAPVGALVLFFVTGRRW